MISFKRVQLFEPKTVTLKNIFSQSNPTLFGLNHWDSDHFDKKTPKNIIA